MISVLHTDLPAAQYSSYETTFDQAKQIPLTDILCCLEMQAHCESWRWPNFYFTVSLKNNVCYVCSSTSWMRERTGSKMKPTWITNQSASYVVSNLWALLSHKWEHTVQTVFYTWLPLTQDMHQEPDRLQGYLQIEIHSRVQGAYYTFQIRYSHVKLILTSRLSAFRMVIACK